MKKSHLAIIIVGFLAIAVYWAVQVFTTDRQRVERLVGRLVGRLEARDGAGLCQYLTEDYKDNNGHTRGSLRGVLSRGLAYFSSIEVTVRDLRVEVEEGDPKTAIAEFDAQVRAYRREQPDRWPGDHRSRVRLYCRKTDDGWRVEEAEYRMPEWRH